ncbi:lipid II:glycine glycyltransferase FemX [Leptospira fluminis]|uniref:lipid II:glycine glycyltransferase FemX n=1 Tax=Leptospira fluminis TaxID=2484979 RepID=UPI00143BCAD5|nr:peptidoglycan bridge formation glycyltransferase FemA/FemB family protein [Leptospira fluminis]
MGRRLNLTIAPLPSFKILFRSLFGFVRKAELAKPWLREGESGIWFSRSAWSLAAIALYRRSLAQKREIIIWLPDYFCNSSLIPLRYLGAEFVFYPVTENREPDFSVCRQWVKEKRMDLFLLAHYFGKPNNATAASELCQGRNAWLIEDAAHLLAPIRGIGEKGDFVLYSPHKHLPIANGAVLVFRNKGPSKLSFSKEEINSIGKLCSDSFAKFGYEKSFTLVWLCKRILQKIGFRSSRRDLSPFLQDISAAGMVSPQVSGLSLRILKRIIPALAEIARTRKRNAIVWNTVLNREESFTEKEFTNSEWIPYLFEKRFANSSDAEKAYAHWNSKNVPVGSWPDLPPEIRDCDAEHLHAIAIRENTLYFPVHQSVRVSEIAEYETREEQNGSNAERTTLLWDQEREKSWENLLKSTDQSNLLQTWSYGEAKKNAEGWNVRRGVFYSRRRFVALVQVLEKRLFGLLTIYRINRGPLFAQGVSEDVRREVFEHISELGSWKKGRLLFMNPELDASGNAFLLLNRYGFSEKSGFPWTSAWIDLTQDAAVLRSRLDGKWRNMLNFSEKAGLTLEVGTGEDETLFRWLIDRYEMLMKEKGFSGIGVPLLILLNEQMRGENSPIIFRAFCEGEAVASICVIPHGLSATYLIGWNGPVGRNLKANQFLLWNAILHLKQRNYDRFDLGGIDSENTRGIAEFKLGLNGKKYELAGEFLKF